jgi:small subunit ribosomal protein S1
LGRDRPRLREKDQLVEGTVITKVKGGLTVDIGVKAFLPGSQLDTKPVKNLDKFIGQKMKFKIIKFNKKRGNIVLSRRAVISQERESLRAETLANLQEGMIVSGTVKNITEYGAFIDLGGMDGLLHITDMSWGRIKHPSELFAVGDEVKVKILKYDREKERVSLGLKQVSPNPWDEVEFKYPVGVKVKGKVVSLKEYGAFVELEDGIEGLIHVSEMSWTERVKHPSKVLKVGDEVECKVLEVDSKAKRISLGLKQLQANPWDELEVRFPVGTIIEEAEVKSVTDFGVFVDVGLGIDGLIHVSDIAWTKKFNHPSERFKKGDKARAVVLSIDKANEKFSLGIKQLERDPWDNIKSRYRQGQAVEGNITKITDFGAFVELEEGIEGLIYISELSENRVEKPSDVAKVGERVRAEILSIEPKERRIGLSIRQLGRSEERANYESYVGERSKKTSMGDVLGDKLKTALNKPDEN